MPLAAVSAPLASTQSEQGMLHRSFGARSKTNSVWFCLETAGALNRKQHSSAKHPMAKANPGFAKPPKTACLPRSHTAQLHTRRKAPASIPCA